MNNDIELNQKAIDELLANANQELPGMDAPSSDNAIPVAPSVDENITTPPEVAVQTTNTPLPFFKSLKQTFTKKVALAIFTAFTSVISLGALLGYQMAHHAIAARTPLETIIQQGITFEEKNFVTYAGFGNQDIVHAFVGAGMSVNVTRSTDGWTPLMAACFYKKTQVVQFLLEENASINVQDLYGRTALMQATTMGAEDIVAMLLEHGADPNLEDKNGRTALAEAYFKKQAAIAEMLKTAGSNLITEPHTLVQNASPSPPTPLAPPAVTTSPPVNAETTLSTGKAGFIQVGMPLTDIQKKYPTLIVDKKFTDGAMKTIATIYVNDPRTPSLQLELSNGTLKLISTISVYDEKFATDKQITIRSTVDDIRKQYTINDVKVIDNSLFIVVKSIKMLFELDFNKNNLPSEWLNTGNPNSIPPETKIKRIVIY